MRLDKLLADSGIGSRKDAKHLIKSRRIVVNQDVATDGKQQVLPEKDHVWFDGRPVVYEPYVYYVLNKPAGVISATHDAHHQTVCDLLPEDIVRRGVFPVGRLDKDTEGLLLLTNNGDLAHQLLAPKKHVAKTYLVTLRYPVTQQLVSAVAHGVVLLDGTICMPGTVRQIDHHTIHLTIHEGKFHQVKRMMQACDNQVTYLKRIAMGPITLPEALPVGQGRRLTAEECDALRPYGLVTTKK